MGRRHKKKVEKSLRALHTVSFRKKSKPSETAIKSRRLQLQGILGRIGGSRQLAQREAPTPAELYSRAKTPLRNLALCLAAKLDLQVLEGVPQAGPGLFIIALSTDSRAVVVEGVTSWKSDHMATYAPSLAAANAPSGACWRAAVGRYALPRIVVRASSAWKPKVATGQSFTCAVCNCERGFWNLWLPRTCASCSVPLAVANNAQLLFSGDACLDVLSSLYLWLRDKRLSQCWRPRRPRRNGDCDFCGKSAGGFNSCSECEALNRWAEHVLLPAAKAELQQIEQLQRDQDFFACNVYEHMQVCKMDLRRFVSECVLFSPEALAAARVSAEAAVDAMDLLCDVPGASSFAVLESARDILMRLQNGGSFFPSFEEIRAAAYRARPTLCPSALPHRPIQPPCSVTPCSASPFACEGDGAAVVVVAGAGGGGEAPTSPAGPVGLTSVVARCRHWLWGTDAHT